MSPWGIVAAVLAALAVLVLVAYGGNEDGISGRERDAFAVRSAPQLVAQPVALGPDAAITVVLERGQASPDVVPPYAAALLPPETAVLLEEVRGLISTAAGQPADQARATLEQAVDQLDLAIDQLEEAAGDTSNDARRIRILRLRLTVELIRNAVEDLIDQL
jgi:hypothetical protein